MQIVIDIPEQMYLNAKANTLCGGDIIVKAIKNGTPLPDGAEILTKEAYSDLCTRAAEQPEKRTEERTETHACDCISRETHVCDCISRETHPCDCISRQAAIDALSHMMDTDGFRDGWAVSRANVDCMLRYLPSVEPERKKGKWKWDQRTGEYVCSECGCNPIYERTTPDCSEIDKYKFCRWCGAEMKGEHT